MNATDILTPTLLFPDRVITSKLDGPGRNRHRFGGPLELPVKGWARRHPPPLRVLTLDLMDPALGLHDTLVTSLPLVYGFQTDGCHFRYQANRDGLVIRDFRGKPLKDWPYRNYPRMFPTRPVFFGRSGRVDWRRLEKDENWHGITWQDSRPSTDELIVVVPGNDAYGVSLWGHWGDYVQTIFRVSLKSLEIEAWNECD